MDKIKIKDIPAVSVLMTAYNRDQYIEDAIKSVLRSDFEDFELIIVDDNSSDNTYSLAHKFVQQDSRIKLYKNKKNLGQFENRNYAASLANAKFIKYLDSDDIIYQSSLRIMYDAIVKFPSAGIGISYQHSISEFPFPFCIESKAAIIKHYLEGGILFPGPSSCIYNKEVFEKVGGFESKYGVPADTHLALKIAALSDVVALPKDLVFWRMHDGQATLSQSNKVNMIIERYLLNKDILYSDYVSLSDREINRINCVLDKILGRYVLKYLIKLKIFTCFKILRATNYPVVKMFSSLFPTNKKTIRILKTKFI